MGLTELRGYASPSALSRGWVRTLQRRGSRGAGRSMSQVAPEPVPQQTELDKLRDHPPRPASLVHATRTSDLLPSGSTSSSSSRACRRILPSTRSSRPYSGRRMRVITVVRQRGGNRPVSITICTRAPAAWHTAYAARRALTASMHRARLAQVHRDALGDAGRCQQYLPLFERRGYLGRLPSFGTRSGRQHHGGYWTSRELATRDERRVRGPGCRSSRQHRGLHVRSLAGARRWRRGPRDGRCRSAA